MNEERTDTERLTWLLNQPLPVVGDLVGQGWSREAIDTMMDLEEMREG